MNNEDFYRIRTFADSGGYKNECSSIFRLPSIDHRLLIDAALRGIDWGRMMSEYVDAILGKFGSFADDWYFLFAPEEDQIEVSQPGVGKDDEWTNEFMRIQNIVLRKMKIYASSHYLFYPLTWKEFNCIIETGGRSRRGFCSCPNRSYEKITDDDANKAKQDGGYAPLPLYGKLSDLKFETRFYWEREYFKLDDWIALHRNGKYVLPGNLINFQDLKYADEQDIGIAEK